MKKERREGLLSEGFFRNIVPALGAKRGTKGKEAPSEPTYSTDGAPPIVF